AGDRGQEQRFRTSGGSHRLLDLPRVPRGHLEGLAVPAVEPCPPAGPRPLAAPTIAARLRPGAFRPASQARGRRVARTRPPRPAPPSSGPRRERAPPPAR